MQYLKEKVLTLTNTAQAVRFLGLASVITIVPFLIHSQWITGSVVNAVLIATLFLVGIRGAIVLALVPSMIALSSGLLPAVLAPVIPFIMIGNVILILTVDFIYRQFKNKSTCLPMRQKGFWLGVTAGALLKFLFLFASVNIISQLLIKQELVIKVVQMMSWPQFYTAMIGGAIAWAMLKFNKNNKTI
ncbi:hypothetical protein J7J13_01870 [bacterium]|nr:hypothetical protein [bacterium]